MAGHSVDDYLETIYFLAFPIGEYTPPSGEPAARVARGRDARRLARVGGRDAEAARGRGADRARLAQGGAADGERPRAGRARRPAAPDHRAAADGLHGLHRRRGARVRGRARRHVLGRHGRADVRAARPSRAVPARLAGRPRLRAGGEPGAASRWRSSARGRARRSSGSRSTTAISCTGSTTRASCPAREIEVEAAHPEAGQFTVRLNGDERAVGEKAAAGLFVRARVGGARATRRGSRPHGLGQADRRRSGRRASCSACALSIRSHVKSWSSRPKCPYAAVFAKIGRRRSRSRMIAAGPQVEVLAHELLDPRDRTSCSVPNVCTAIETGRATPIAYATFTSHRSASPAATTFFAT